MKCLALAALLCCTPQAQDSHVTAPPSASATVTASVTSTAIPGADSLDEAWPPGLLARLAKAADAIPAGQLVGHPVPDAERDRAIQRSFGQRCHLERTCGSLWGIDCEAAVDGPYYYARPHADHVEQITVCGGACMGGRCTNCPPRAQGWTCATY